MRIVNVRIDSRGQIMELKATEGYIGFSVSDYINQELAKIIKSQKESYCNEIAVIQLSVEVCKEF